MDTITQALYFDNIPTMSFVKPTIVFVEGNIGSGKSTLVKEAFDHYVDNDRVLFIQEPVDEWKTIKDKDGKDIISKYYADQVEYGFKFQMMAYITRLKDLKNAMKENKYDVIICERSLNTDKNVFAKMLYDDGIIDEIGYQIYTRWFDCFTDILPETKYVYLRTDPEICSERVMKRNRTGEENIPQEYLDKIHQYHETWLNDEGDKFLNGNETVEFNRAILFGYIDSLLSSSNESKLFYPRDDGNISDDNGEELCFGCKNNEPNQEAHMGPGGCCYDDDEFV